MVLERSNFEGDHVLEVLERVLDKGIVVDAWIRMSVMGIDLITVEAHVIVASIATYFEYADAVGGTVGVSKPRAKAGRSRSILGVPVPSRTKAPSPSSVPGT